MYTSLFIIICVLSICDAIAPNTGATPGTIPATPDPTSSLMNMLSILKQSQANLVSDIKEPDGFKYITNDMTYVSGTINGSKAGELQKLFGFLIKKTELDKLDPFVKGQIQDYFIETESQLITKKGYNYNTFNMQYNGVDGTVFLIHAKIARSDEIPEGVYYERCLLTSKFKPADSYVIITESDANFFSSSTSQHIVYIPANIRPNHFNSIIALNTGIIQSIFNNNAPAIK